MKSQAKSSRKRGFPVHAVQDLKEAYRALDFVISRHPWLAQGSVNVVDPKSQSASTTYTWTRKVRAKTVTVALSLEQSIAFRKAIDANRQLEAALNTLRQISQSALLEEISGVTKRRSDTPATQKLQNVPNGA